MKKLNILNQFWNIAAHNLMFPLLKPETTCLALVQIIDLLLRVHNNIKTHFIDRKMGFSIFDNRDIKEFKQKNINQNALIALMFTCTFTVIVGFITLQTLTSSPENNSFGPAWMPKIWTFVYCTRYFIYIMFLIIILFFIAYNQSKQEKN